MYSNPKIAHTLTILLVGESDVGKTCLTRRFIDNEFTSLFYDNLEVENNEKIIRLNGELIRLEVSDSRGSNQFRPTTQRYYDSSDGIAVVYDISERFSFDAVPDWISDIEQITKIDKKAMVLIGNKVDKSSGKVQTEEGMEMANKYGFKHFETSAKINYNIDEAFRYLIEEILFRRSIKKETKSERLSEEEKRENFKLAIRDKYKFKYNKKCGCSV